MHLFGLQLKERALNNNAENSNNPKYGTACRVLSRVEQCPQGQPEKVNKQGNAVPIESNGADSPKIETDPLASNKPSASVGRLQI